MRRLYLWATSLATVAVLFGALSASAAGPPPSLTGYLTPNGKVIWNLDALINDTYGARTDCWDDKEFNVFAVGHDGDCPAPTARYQDWVFTFLNARDSDFRLVARSRPPPTGVTDVPVRVDRHYISCPDPEYSGPGWLVYGGGGGPEGLFWCE